MCFILQGAVVTYISALYYTSSKDQTKAREITLTRHKILYNSHFF